MTLTSLPGWIEAACAVLAICGALASWVGEKYSRRAREQAEEARRAAVVAEARAELAEARASKEVAAAENTAADMRRLADRLEGPPVKTDRDGEYAVYLRNQRRQAISVVKLLNRASFEGLDNLPDTFTLPPYATLKFAQWGRHPGELLLLLAEGETLHVAL